MASTVFIFDTDTKLMLHADGDDAATTFIDSSTGGRSITANGNAQIDTAQSKFGGASGLFDGTGDYLSTADSDDWNLAAGDFTIDFQVRFASVATAQTFVAQFVGPSGYNFAVDWTTANLLRFVYTTDGTLTTIVVKSVSWTPVADTWYHVAVVRNGNNLYFFVDGTQVGATQDVTGLTLPDVGSELYVGAIFTTLLINQMNGWLDEVRLVKGTAVWTANFTAPTAAYLRPSKNLAALGVG